MLMTFLGALSVAVLAACVAFIARRWTGIDAKWIIPASAGAAMLGFTLWNDYAWFGRIERALPPEVVVARTFDSVNPMQPWTLLAPAVNRFQAVNRASIVRHGADPGVIRAEVFLVARFQPTFVALTAFDCARGLQADAAAPTDAGGLPVAAAWIEVGRDDALLRAACGRG